MVARDGRAIPTNDHHTNPATPPNNQPSNIPSILPIHANAQTPLIYLYAYAREGDRNKPHSHQISMAHIVPDLTLDSIHAKSVSKRVDVH